MIDTFASTTSLKASTLDFSFGMKIVKTDSENRQTAIE